MKVIKDLFNDYSVTDWLLFIGSVLFFIWIAVSILIIVLIIGG